MAALSGLRIVVTRAAHQAEELAAPLRQLGAEVILLPTIAIGPPSDLEPLRLAAGHANEYDWIIFTSQNSVEAFAAHTRVSGSQGFQIAAVGRATADAVERRGFKVALVPEKYVAESLVEVFASKDLCGKRVLIPSAAVTRDLIPRKLQDLGAIVTVVEAYRNVMPEDLAKRATVIFRDPLPDWVLFASPSAIEHLAAIVDLHVLERVKIATIGPVTSSAVAKCGLPVTVEANPHDVAGLIAVIVENSKK